MGLLPLELERAICMVIDMSIALEQAKLVVDMDNLCKKYGYTGSVDTY